MPYCMEDRVGNQSSHTSPVYVTVEQLFCGCFLPSAVSDGEWGGRLSQYADNVHLPQFGYIKQDTLGLASCPDIGGNTSAIGYSA